MKPSIWAGSEASYEVVANFQQKFSLDKVAYARSPFDREDDRVDYDATFGVESDRKGLTVLEMVGDTPVIKVHGSLVANYHRYHSWFPGEVTSYEAINDALAIVQEYGAENVLMDFASGGGQVSQLDTVVKNMARVQKAGVHIHGHSDSASMSASYWMMAGASTITASRMAEVGNIGTMAILRTYADTETNMGVKFTVFKEGEYKGLGNPYEDLSERDKSEIQKNLKKANSFFLSHVASNRGTDLTDTLAWAEGRTFYADEAVKNGLIDQVIDLDDLIGSGASAQTLGDKRIFGMKISPEKLAQIEAGADAKTVLTAAEFKQYKADMDALAVSAQAEADAEKLAADAKKLLEDEGNEDGGKPAVKPEATTESATLASDFRDALRANGRLEAKAEALAEKVVAAEAKLAAAQAETNSLITVAKHAISKLQVATGSAAKEFTTAAEILGEFNTLQDKLAKIFPTDRQSVDKPAVTDEESANTASAYRLKTQQLNAQTR